MSLHKHHLVMYQITQMIRHWMSHPLLIITYHQHLNFNMLKTWIMLLQVVRLHGYTTGYSSGEFVIGQVFNSKSDLQEVAKIYSIKAHKEFVVVTSSKKLLVLRCKKAEECHCRWKLRAMVVKDTSLFVINKCTRPHSCVNPCLNRDHHQLDSKLVDTHIKD